ncbi:MAG: hypothetical protein ABIS59_00655 [Candidatus Saccharibacteria bacterium]
MYPLQYYALVAAVAFAGVRWYRSHSPKDTFVFIASVVILVIVTVVYFLYNAQN